MKTLHQLKTNLVASPQYHKTPTHLQATAQNSPNPLQYMKDKNNPAFHAPILQAMQQQKSLQMKQDPTQLNQLDEEELQMKENQPTTKQENNTGLPDNLKSGIENLSGYSLDDVKVHYNSNKPAQLQAHAYAQGTQIHIAPGQEKHLPHEAWHVVQQKQGRVQPTMQMKGSININDDAGLEKEADVMGQKH
jgi:hypothetical protein